ncbi:uncharacterized protein DSM5745_00419 [Aspergillus mulundensis]|uniref:F-box domain-containing protein n=1 Tax=Aspergillus mulundensis TaxID=1810919 RepID=A0A3D8T3G1_9EURO|nr:hypothetical protein DSM5745_00419 [Aspergillus mulundensis]RDW93097.1 hypothetical protein DSM5745_00419 [Aspergillus mulundensis]
MPPVQSGSNVLGDLSKLPAELRIMVYNYLVPSLGSQRTSHENETSSDSEHPDGASDPLFVLFIEQKQRERLGITPNPEPEAGVDSDPNPDPFAILRTSKAIYNEASYELYRKLNIEFFIRPVTNNTTTDSPYVRIRELNFAETIFECALRPAGDSIREMIRDLPYANAPSITVNVYPPEFDTTTRQGENAGPGLVLLWDRINKIVNALVRAKTLRSLTLSFCRPVSERSGWVDLGKKQGRVSVQRLSRPEHCSTKAFITRMKIDIEREMYDHEVLFLPFFRLAGHVQNMSVTYAGADFNIAACTPDSEAKYLDWTFHRIALRHLFHAPGGVPSKRAELVLKVFPRLIAETNLFNQYAVRNSSSTLRHEIRRESLWRPNSAKARAQRVEDPSETEKLPEGMKWTWPDFVFALDETRVGVQDEDEESEVDEMKE